MQEQTYEAFKPGDLLQMKRTPGFTPRHTFVVIVGGYMIKGEWRPVISEVPLTTRDFEKVGHLE